MIHAAHNPGRWGHGATTVVALCARMGVVWANAEVTPKGFDFVFVGNPGWREKVTCPGCRARAPECAGELVTRLG